MVQNPFIGEEGFFLVNVDGYDFPITVSWEDLGDGDTSVLCYLNGGSGEYSSVVDGRAFTAQLPADDVDGVSLLFFVRAACEKWARLARRRIDAVESVGLLTPGAPYDVLGLFSAEKVSEFLSGLPFVGESDTVCLTGDFGTGSVTLTNPMVRLTSVGGSSFKWALLTRPDISEAQVWCYDSGTVSYFNAGSLDGLLNVLGAWLQSDGQYSFAREAAIDTEVAPIYQGSVHLSVL